MSLFLAVLLLFQDKSVERLLEQLRSDKPENAAFAFQALKESGKAAEAPLIRTLSDPEPRVRSACLQLLAHLKSASALARATELFQVDGDAAVRQEAFLLLEVLGKESESAFLAGLKSSRAETQMQSILGLRALRSGQGLELVAEVFLGAAAPDLRSAAGDYLQSQGLRAEEVLIRGLNGKDSVIRLSSIRILGQIGSLKGLEAISRLFREDKNRELHETCFKVLSSAGIKAEKDLLLALDDEDPEIRRLSVVALGEACSERAVPRLLELLTGLDQRMREASEEALAEIGPKAAEEIHKGVASGKLGKDIAERIDAASVRIAVERSLEAQLGEDEFAGFYEGQFKDLEAFGRARVVPILISILKERTYVLRHAERHVLSGTFREAMRELAVMALGELGGDDALKALKSYSVEDLGGESPRLREETLISLYRLGEKKPLEDHLRKSREDADRLLKAELPDLKESGCDQLFSIGLLVTRLRRYEEAIQVFGELLSAMDAPEFKTTRLRYYPIVSYNLACIQSIRGERAKAVDWLGKAIRSGFKDRAWIKKDRDLDPIRNEDGYQKLLSDDSLFDKKQD